MKIIFRLFFLVLYIAFVSFSTNWEGRLHPSDITAIEENMREIGLPSNQVNRWRELMLADDGDQIFTLHYYEKSDIYDFSNVSLQSVDDSFLSRALRSGSYPVYYGKFPEEKGIVLANGSIEEFPYLLVMRHKSLRTIAEDLIAYPESRLGVLNQSGDNKSVSTLFHLDFFYFDLRLIFALVLGTIFLLLRSHN